MDLKVLLTTFGMIILAELGDKTQLATLSFAAGSKSKLPVFIGAAGALIVTSLLAVVLGSFISKWVPSNYVRIGAAVLFIVLGVWMMVFPGSK